MSLENISEDGIFSIVAIDHRNSLRRLINKENPLSVSTKKLEEIKYEFGKVFFTLASGILIDPEYGRKCIEFLKINKKSFILPLEKSGYKEENGRINELMEAYSTYVKKLKPSAIKLLIYYNPTDKSSKKQKELVKKVRKEFDLPFICEIRTYENEKLKDKKELVIKSVAQISKFADIMKVEIPGEISEKNFEKLDKKCKVPWILLSAGISYEDFKKGLEIASKFCSGFAVGRALWQDSIKNGKLDKNFLKKVCVNRLKELKDMAKKCVPYFAKSNTIF